MMRDRMYERNYRLRSPSPRRRRVSPPPVRFRDRGYSKPRCPDSMNAKDERRGGSYSRRDYDRRYERGDKDYDYGGRSEPDDRDYERCYDRGDRDYGRNYERGSRDHRRNFYREEDKRYDGRLDYGGARVSEFDGGNKNRYREGNTDATRSSIYQSISDAGYSGRVLRNGEVMFQENSTSPKFQWDHLLNEPKKRKGIKESTHHGTNGSGIKAELGYGYQRSRHFDEGRARVPLNRKTAAMEAETGRDYSSSSYQMDAGGLHKCSSHVDAVGSFITVPSNFSNRILRKDEEFHFLHKPRLVDGPLMEGQLAREANLLPYSRAAVDFMASSSRSKAFGAGSDGSFKDDSLGSLIPSDGLKFCSGVSTSCFGYDEYRAKQARPPVEGRGTLDDFKSYSRSYVDAAGGRSSNFSNSGVCQSERSVVVTRPVEFYEKMESIGDRYDHQDMSRVVMLDSTNNELDGSSPHGYLTRNRFWDPTTALGQSSSSYYDTHELSYASRQNVQNQDFGCPRPLHERDFYDGHTRSSIRGGLHYDYRLVRSSWSPEKGTDRLSPRTFEPNFSNSNGQSRQELLSDDIGFPRSSKMSRLSYDTDKQANGHDSMVYDRGSTGETWRNNIDSIISPKKFKLKNSKNGKTRKISSLLEHQKLSSSFPRYSGKPLRFGNCDIKKRLGPGPQKAHVLEHVTRKFKPSLRKRLGPGPQKAHVLERVTRKFKPSLRERLRPSPQKRHFTPPPWVRHLKAPQFPGYEDASNRSNLHQGEETQEYSGTATKSEPPENSEEFRQLMFSAFFKFVKQLNETPAKRKKYKEQGEAGNLKCIICGREFIRGEIPGKWKTACGHIVTMIETKDYLLIQYIKGLSCSEEFENTESLATHAFQSLNDGLRSQHLGFHKALCAVMGWSAEAVNGVWLCETLSQSEHLCMNEDLILWPPAVIVHNSTITNQNPDQRVVITLEKLEARLRDMGFEDKIKVHRGKPANQSIMVVQFGGTLSGLLEAQRLHKMYSKIKRGRLELQLQEKSCNNEESHSDETKTSSKELENFLYGYLGTAEDLDKLDFDMKKRCVVKSKKDIQNIAEARLKTVTK